jgi:lipoprotein-anchoring transpeptidase ErfK/SrfK
MKKILMTFLALSVSAAMAQTPAPAAKPASAPQMTEEQEFTQTLRVQVLLDRWHFSVGEIDGVMGSNVRRSLKAFQQEKGLEPSGEIDQPTLTALGDNGSDLMVSYTLTAEDVNQPLKRSIPRTMLGMSKAGNLHYTSLEEALGEKFQISPKLLKKLNPDVELVEGTVLKVPGVGQTLSTKVAKIVVSQSESSVRIYDASEKLIGFYPTTLGSPKSPPPFGQLKVVAVAKDPYYNYDPERFVSPGTNTKVTLRPGPNNPVGEVWIALSRKHYGIHGTPEPSKISKTASNGCIRLTNWDALEVADLVEKGTLVIVER